MHCKFCILVSATVITIPVFVFLMLLDVFALLDYEVPNTPNSNFTPIITVIPLEGVLWEPRPDRPIPESVQRQFDEIISKDVGIRGSCKRMGIDVVRVRQFGDTWGTVPLDREGCENSCVLTDNAVEADLLYYHSATANRPVKTRTGQKVLAFGIEPRPYVDGLWSEDVARNTDAVSNYNLDSNIPVPYLESFTYSKSRSIPVATKENWETRKFMIWLSSNCVSGRTDRVKEIMKHLPVEARGKCLNNAPQLISGFWEVPNTLREYKFALYLEKIIDQDYVTEKFIMGFFGDTIPVYSGSRTALLLAPGNHSFIDMDNFESVEELAAYVKEVGSDYNKWKRYFDWRASPTAPEKEVAASWRGSSSLCRMCDYYCNETGMTGGNAGNGLRWA